MNLSPSSALKLIPKGIFNYVTNRPLVISFEVTLSCNCNCRHCDLGGIVKDEKQIKPSDYAKITQRVNPLVVQISGGEPFLRKDIVDIVKAIKEPKGIPYLIFVTNGALLDEGNYQQLHEAGVNQFSVSLDFPDERHDEFRRHRGLYKHLDQIIPQLAKLGYRDIILNSVITRANLKEVFALAQKAKDWNVSISYSPYTPLRTHDNSYAINNPEELALLRKTIYELIELKKQNKHITNPKSVFLNSLKFFEQGYMPNCKAGIRFFVVMPDGSFIPCSLHRNKYCNQKEMIEDFSRTNQCGACYVSIRSYSDQSLWKLLKEVPAYGKQLFAHAQETT